MGLGVAELQRIEALEARLQSLELSREGHDKRLSKIERNGHGDSEPATREADVVAIPLKDIPPFSTGPVTIAGEIPHPPSPAPTVDPPRILTRPARSQRPHRAGRKLKSSTN